ncbi:hypothetical protein [Phenylobacterium aquaticum]|uniref:hypothetical protein n=1 Tax=Phenylobacterium aquaticum TaxID=1763816 RepID=UPI0026EA5B89|nr:hypothetical protein [Phenylobacterium aquaticum]
MDIHKPKPVHSWREFLSEIGVIVCGVLIALALEQTVEWAHWQREVRLGREHLREEISFNERVYLHRLDVAPCVARNLTELKGVITEVRAHKHVGPIPQFISPENGPIRHEIWNSLSAGQVLVHFPKNELSKYSQFYQYVQDDEYAMDRESRAWRQLHLLEGDPNQLSAQDISNLRVAVGDAQEMSAEVGVISRMQVEVGRALGLDLKPDPAWRHECEPIVRL